MSGNFGLWRAPTADIRILHRSVSRSVVTSQVLVSSSQVADRTRVLNYFHDMLVASYSRTIMIDHLDVRIKIEVMAERDQVLFDFLCWSDKPEKDFAPLMYFCRKWLTHLDQFGFWKNENW